MRTVDPFSLQAAAQRVWAIRFLLPRGAMDLTAAVTSLERLRMHPHPRIAALADATLCDIADRLIFKGKEAA